MRTLAIGAFLLAGISAAASAFAAEKVPDYADFATGAMYRGRHAHPDFDTPQSLKYRTRLIDGAVQSPNFASHYRLILWGCGTSCVQGAVVDLVDGEVAFLPFSVTNASAADLDGHEAIEFQPRSTLIVLRGQLNEEGSAGPHFYSFDGRNFAPVAASAKVNHFAASPPSGSELATCQKIADNSARLKCYDAVTGYRTP